jgi:hypothetical protein
LADTRIVVAADRRASREAIRDLLESAGALVTCCRFHELAIESHHLLTFLVEPPEPVCAMIMAGSGHGATIAYCTFKPRAWSQQHTAVAEPGHSYWLKMPARGDDILVACELASRDRVA